MAEPASRAEVRLGHSDGPELLWCCHCRGPDEVHATRSYEQALALADALTDRFDRFKQSDDPNMPYVRAVPALWPWSAELHAEAIPRTEEGFGAWAGVPA